MPRFRDHDPAFLRRLRRAVRERAASRKWKLKRPSWERRVVGGNGAWWVLFVAIVPVLGLMRPGGTGNLSRAGVEAAAALVNLFLVADMERRIVALMGHWPDLMAALRLPTSNDWMARRQLALASRRIPLLFVASLTASGLVVVFSDPSWVAFVGAVIYSGVMTAVVVAAALWLAGTGRGGWLSGALWCMAIAGWMGGKIFPGLVEWAADLLNRNGDWIVLILPTGWVIRPFHGSLVTGTHREWLGLLPAAVLVASIPAARRRLMEVCRLRDRVLLMHASQLPDDATEEARRDIQSALSIPPSRSDPELSEEILSRRFLGMSLSPAGRGRIERLVWTLWTSRDRSLAEIAYPVFPSWTRSYLMCLAFLIPIMGSSMLGGGFRVLWVIGIGIVLLGLTPVPPVLGRLGASWWVGQGTVIAAGLFPIGFREVAGWALKTSRIRLILGSGPAVVVGTLIGFLESDTITPAGGFWCSVVVLMGVAGLQPFWLLESLFGSSWRQFTGGWGWVRSLALAGMLVGWLVLVGLAMAAAAMGRPVAGLGLGASSLAMGPIALSWVGRHWSRGRLELVVLPEAGKK